MQACFWIYTALLNVKFDASPTVSTYEGFTAQRTQRDPHSTGTTQPATGRLFKHQDAGEDNQPDNHSGGKHTWQELKVTEARGKTGFSK